MKLMPNGVDAFAEDAGAPGFKAGRSFYELREKGMKSSAMRTPECSEPGKLSGLARSKFSN
jgi:hypothetical protein